MNHLLRYCVAVPARTSRLHHSLNEKRLKRIDFENEGGNMACYLLTGPAKNGDNKKKRRKKREKGNLST